MRKGIFSLVLGLLLVVPSVQATVERDFFRNEAVAMPTISPGGKFLLVKAENEQGAKVLVRNLETNNEAEVHSLSLSSRYQIGDYHWIDDDTFTLTIYHPHRAHHFKVFNVDEELKLTMVEDVENTYLFDTLINVPDSFVVVKYKYDSARLFKIKLNNGSLEGQTSSRNKINRGPLDNGRWLLSANGKAHVNFGLKDNNNLTYVRYGKSKKWHSVWQGNKEEVFHPVLFDEANKELLVISNKDGGYHSLYRFNVETKEFSRLVHRVPGKDIASILISPYTRKVLGYSYLQGGIAKRVYNESLKDFLYIEAENNNAIPEGYVIDFDRDRSTVVYIRGSIDKPVSYYRYHRNSKEHILIGDARPWLNEYTLGRSQVLNSVSTDGLKIESYLTLPGASANKPFPLIVLPHGGPLGVQDTRHFSEEIQYLAQKGYAVLTPNYRGSSGFGSEFLDSGKQQWGRLIEDDIESAVEEALKTGKVDREKICIFGISYGGYSALISAIRRPDLYKCAISYAGVTDLPLLFSQSHVDRDEGQQKMLAEILGDPTEDWDTLIKYSPAYQLENLTVPVLIGQGGQDRIVNDEHFFRLVYLLDKQGKQYTKLYLENEIHGFRKVLNKIAFFRAVDMFVKDKLDLAEDE